MGSLAFRSGEAATSRAEGEQLRVGFVGSLNWIESSAPPRGEGFVSKSFPLVTGEDPERGLHELAGFAPHVTVIFDPTQLPHDAFGSLPGLTLGLLVGGLPGEDSDRALVTLDRIASFKPALTGAAVAGSVVWRAIPPPISDALFADVRQMHAPPRVMSIGRATPHRDAMLLGAKHHHTLLELLHGVGGATMARLLGEYDVGVYIAPERGGGFGAQVGMHLAAGQLLLVDNLAPAHGLERDIDYLHVADADALVWMLDRLGRFPEMYQRIRVRGRMKAEQYRSSRLFARVVHDLLADVEAFGGNASERSA
ncbi:MAG: hypothetical protein ABSC56_12210 [Solirubrobacteraceae bacterium]|jgi:hypothetical protein